MDSSIDERDYPVKKTISADGKTVLIEFSADKYFGNHDSSESGERAVDVIDLNGVSLFSDSVNISLISSSKYFGSSRNTRQRLTINPEVCPVKVLVNEFSSYSTSDYPHFDQDTSDYYFILVEK